MGMGLDTPEWEKWESKLITQTSTHVISSNTSSLCTSNVAPNQ